MTTPVRYRVDDLRRSIASSLEGAGVGASRASGLAGTLLWYESAGHGEFGVGRLPGWLDRLKAGQVNPAVEGRVGRPEFAGTAIVDGDGGLAPVVLARAAEIAMQKARETGAAVVRVANLPADGPTAEVAAEVSLGPYLTTIVGPGPSWTLALPTANGLPLVYDSALAGGGTPDPLAAAWLGSLGASLVPGDGWLISVIAIHAVESLAAFQERMAALAGEVAGRPGWLVPEAWEAARRAVREEGIRLSDDVAAWLRPA
jgi:LDH2 family malate/lactate/ureidoglycolate dehydrogenase